MSTTPELTYFDARGLAEIIRLLLTAADIKFTEVDLQTREEFLALLPELPFKQVPLLRIDGLNLVQSGAIVRYIARKANLFGKTEEETVRIDMLYEASRDLYRPYTTIGWACEFDKVEAMLKPYTDKFVPFCEQLLKSNGTGFLFGNSLSLADLGLFEVLLATVDYSGAEVFEGFPEVQGFHKRISSLESIQRYLKEIRKPANTPDGVKQIKKILGQ